MYYKNYLDNLPITTRNVIDALYFAFAKAHCMNLSRKKVIILHPYSHYMTLKFHKIYPRSKVLIPFRHPVNAYVSGIKNIALKDEMRVSVNCFKSVIFIIYVVMSSHFLIKTSILGHGS